MLMMMLALALAPASSPKPDLFTAQAELQGLYEEIGEAIMHAPAGDPGIETMRAVLYSPDWEFIDASGQHQSWQQASAASAAAFRVAPFAVIRQAIQNVKINGDAATVIVKIAVETDTPQAGASDAKVPPPQAQTTTYRDTWVKSGDTWKMKSREQLGKADSAAALY